MATAEIRHHVSTAGSLTPSEAALHSAPLREPFLPLLISALDARTPRAARQRARPPRGRRKVFSTLPQRAVKPRSSGRGYKAHLDWNFDFPAFVC